MDKEYDGLYVYDILFMLSYNKYMIVKINRREL